MSPLSLQAHIVSSQPQSSAIAVDPRGFKTALQSFIKFLISQQVQATLWLKLPKDDAWWEDVWQYGQQAPGCTLYAFGTQTGTPPDDLAAKLRTIPIEQSNDFKREYFCIAISSKFVGALLAARQSVTAQTIGQTTDKRTLNLYCSASPCTVRTLSAGLKAVLENGSVPQDRLLEIADSSSRDSHSAAAVVLSQWDRCFPNDLLNQNWLPLNDAFLTWQLRFQEELRLQINDHLTNQKSDAAGNALTALSPSFLSQASQELQSPLTTIKTALTLLGSSTLKLAQRQRYLDMISAQCDRQKSLITSIMDLLKLQTADHIAPQAIQLADIIPGIVSTYQPIAEERGIMLAYTVPPNLAEVLGVESELKQILIHLIQNGIQITSKGGRVWVAAMPYDADFLALTVQDSGCGIAPANVSKLFEAFYRQPVSSHPGAGLGLTLVQQLVSRIGGRISAESTPNKGTTFKILLPIRKPDSTGPKPIRTSQPMPKGASSLLRSAGPAASPAINV